MAELMDHVSMIAEQIGPRPVSTEEEHEAAEYVAQEFRDAGLDVDIDEFATPTGTRWPYALAFGLVIIATLISGLTIFLPELTTSWYALALLLSVVGVAIYFTELTGRPILSKMFARGVSQNVVARYVPSSVAHERRRRKIIFVAHIDTTRAQLEAGPKFINRLPLLKKAIYFDMFGLLAVLFIRLLPLPWPDVVDTVLLIVSLIGCLLLLAAVVCIVAQRFTGFVSGANDNASSLAVVIDLAHRFLDPEERKRFALEEEQDDVEDDPYAEYAVENEKPVIHGKEASIAAGLIPDGAEISYADEEENEGFDADQSGQMPVEDEFVAAQSGPHLTDEMSGAVAEAAAATIDAGIPAEPVVLTEAMKKERAAALAQKQQEQEEHLAQLRAEQEAKELEEKQKQSGLPSWYITARERAAKEEDANEDQEKQKVRSRFADTPMTAEDLEALQESEKTEEAFQVNSEPEPIPVQEKLQPVQTQSEPDKTSVKDETLVEEKALPEDELAKAEDETNENVAASKTSQAQTQQEEAHNSALPWLSGSAEEIDEIVASAVEPISATMPKLTSDDFSAESVVAQISGSDDAENISEKSDYHVAEIAEDFEFEEESVDESEEKHVRRPGTTSLLGRIPTVANKEDEEVADEKTQAKARTRQGRRKPRARTVSDDFVPTKAVDEREDDDFLSKSRQAAAVASEYEATPQSAYSAQDYAQKAKNPALSTQFSPASADSFASNSSDDLGATSSFPSLTGSFPSLTGSFPSLTGSFERISPSELDASDFGTESYGSEEDFDLFARNSGPEFEVPESKLHDAMDNMTGLFSRIGRKNKKKNKRHQEDDPWASDSDDFGWKGGAYVPESEQDEMHPEEEFAENTFQVSRSYKAFDGDYDPEQALKERAAKIRESVITMTENDMLDKEVWFVGLGASSSSNKGMKNFLELHHSELRGALIVNLEGIGSGDICFVDYEGNGKLHRSDRRLQSLVRKTSKEIDGEEISAERLDWRDTDATPALSAGLRAMTIMGFDGVAPTGWHTLDDTVDIVEEEKLEYVTNLLLRMIENS